MTPWLTVLRWRPRKVKRIHLDVMPRYRLLRGDVAFKLFDTHGLPLALQIDAARAKLMGVDLPGFYRCAIEAGWSPEKARAVVREAIADTQASPRVIEVAA